MSQVQIPLEVNIYMVTIIRVRFSQMQKGQGFSFLSEYLVLVKGYGFKGSVFLTPFGIRLEVAVFILLILILPYSFRGVWFMRSS